MKTYQTSAKVSIPIDHLPPDVRCMVGAFWSRSTTPIADRLPEVNNKKAIESIRKKLNQFYIGYTHESIGAMGETAIAIEGLSTLAAYEIENTPLFRGQESSTRYIDLNLGKTSIRELVDALPQRFAGKAALGRELDKQADAWEQLYVEALEKLPAAVERTYDSVINEHLANGCSDEDIKKAIAPFCFDIARGLLPISSKTSMIWVGDFQVINQHIDLLLGHPLPELRSIGISILNTLKDTYPDVAKPLENRKEVVDWYRKYPGLYFPYFNTPTNIDLLSGYDVDALNSRPNRAKIPHSMYFKALVSGRAGIDFGSLRDIHRHRYGVCSLYRFTTVIEQFYLSHIDRLLGAKFCDRVTDLAEKNILREAVTEDDIALHFTQAYALPLGARCVFNYEYGLPAATYLAELRVAETVHPTARRFAYEKIAKPLSALGIKHHVRTDVTMEHVLSIKRGKQTIAKKG